MVSELKPPLNWASPLNWSHGRLQHPTQLVNSNCQCLTAVSCWHLIYLCVSECMYAYMHACIYIYIYLDLFFFYICDEIGVYGSSYSSRAFRSIMTVNHWTMRVFSEKHIQISLRCVPNSYTRKTDIYNGPLVVLTASHLVNLPCCLVLHHHWLQSIYQHRNRLILWGCPHRNLDHNSPNVNQAPIPLTIYRSN